MRPDVTIEYEQVADYLTKIFTEASSDTLPDLIACQVGYTQQFADAGILEKIDTEKLKADKDFNFDDLWETTLSYAKSTRMSITGYLLTVEIMHMSTIKKSLTNLELQFLKRAIHGTSL